MKGVGTKRQRILLCGWFIDQAYERIGILITGDDIPGGKNKGRRAPDSEFFRKLDVFFDRLCFTFRLR